MIKNNNSSGHINDGFHAFEEHTHNHGHEHGEHCGCGENACNDHDGSHANLYAASNEIPGIYSDEIKILLKKETKWGAFTGSLANWIEGSRLWLRSNKFLIGHIKIFAAGTNSKTLWLATTGRSLNTKYSPELINCRNESLDSCRLSMTFIVFKIGGDRLKKEILERLEENIGIYKT